MSSQRSPSNSSGEQVVGTTALSVGSHQPRGQGDVFQLKGKRVSKGLRIGMWCSSGDDRQWKTSLTRVETNFWGWGTDRAGLLDETRLWRPWKPGLDVWTLSYRITHWSWRFLKKDSHDRNGHPITLNVHGPTFKIITPFYFFSFSLGPTKGTVNAPYCFLLSGVLWWIESHIYMKRWTPRNIYRLPKGSLPQKIFPGSVLEFPTCW